MLKALIFDCDGVLVDTERDGHRVGFNMAFKEMGINADWDVELYEKLLQTAGGKERMTVYFEEFGWPEGTSSADEKVALIADLHKRKTAIVSKLVNEGDDMPLRPGISRIVDEAIAAGVTLGVCTTSNPKFIDAVLNKFGAERKAKFVFVHAGDVVSKKKPDPEIYNLARTSLDVGGSGPAPHECCVIEDSRVGFLAATGAGLPTLVTTSTYTGGEDFTGAIKVVAELGDEPNVNVTLAELSELAAATA